MKPVALDLFCGAGGASMGLARDALTAGMYLLADQHLSWRNATCGIADLAVSGLNIWLAGRTFDRFFEEMCRSSLELAKKLVGQESP